MRIRMTATGQVEDFAEGFARRAIESGMATALDAKPKDTEKPGMPEFTAPETGAVAPHNTAMLGRPLFTRAPRGQR